MHDQEKAKPAKESIRMIKTLNEVLENGFGFRSGFALFLFVCFVQLFLFLLRGMRIFCCCWFFCL